MSEKKIEYIIKNWRKPHKPQIGFKSTIITHGRKKKIVLYIETRHAT